MRRELDLQYHGLALRTIATWPAPPVDEVGEFSFRMRNEFAAALQSRRLVEIKAEVPAVLPAEKSAVEGKLVEQMTQHRSREMWLRDAKIGDASSKSRDGRLRCSVPGCGFDFVEVYGEVGEGYIQVHHLKPLSNPDKPEQTKLEDLALVCANCHTMIHRFGENRPMRTLVRGVQSGR